MPSPTVDAWDAAAQRPNYQQVVHPTGNDPELYQASGQAEVAQLLELFHQHSRREPCSSCGGTGTWPTDEGIIEHRQCPDCQGNGYRPHMVLEFGVGDGRILAEWPTSWDRWGCDASATMVARLRGRCPNAAITTFVWDGSAPWATEAQRAALQFDLVYAVTVLIHHTQADGMAMVPNLGALLAPGGLLLLGHPLYSVATDDGTWNGVTTWQLAQLQTAADTAGLDLVEAWQSPGEFSFGHLGAFHGATQVLRKPGGQA